MASRHVPSACLLASSEPRLDREYPTIRRAHDCSAVRGQQRQIAAEVRR